MRNTKAPAYFGPLFLSMCLAAALLISLASTLALHAQTQTPSPGVSVSVKMIDAVDSGSDPAGKQYRASVAKAVDAGDGVAIPQGAVAVVVLARSGSSWGAQLASVTVNGQPVPVTSSSANVTSAAQNAAGAAANAVSSVFGGFGHHTNVPSSVTAVAMGQRVVLPIGTTLNFVLAAAASASASPAAASSAPVAQPPTAPGPSSASSLTAASASEQLGSYRCYYHGQKITHDLSAPADNQIVYVTPIFHAAVSARFSVIQAFSNYMRTAYDLSKIEAPTAGCDSGVEANVPASQEKQWAASKTEVVNVNWTGTPAELAAATPAASAAPATASPGGPFISCSTRGTPGVAIYVTGIFQTTLPVKQSPNGAKFVDQSVLDHFHAYLTQQGYKFTPGSNGGCDVSPTEAAAEAAQHTRIHGNGGSCGYCGYKVVETGWKDTQ